MPTTEEWQQVAAQQIVVLDAVPIACEILSACACTREDGFLGVADALDYLDNTTACDLAWKAWNIAAKKKGWNPTEPVWDLYYEICAEAEALLQTGEYVLYE
jgi:hypothetical protein